MKVKDIQIEIGECFKGQSMLDDAVQCALKRLADYAGARAGSLWLLREGVIRCFYCLDKELEGMELELSEGIIGYVATTGKDHFSNQPGGDPYKSSKIDDELGYSIRNVLGVPLLHDGAIVGALEFVDQIDAAGFYKDGLKCVKRAADVIAESFFSKRHQQSIKKRERELNKKMAALDRFGWFLGKSSAIQSVIQQADIAARSGFPVLITGETGTGKEVLARAIHENSARKRKPFIAENCAALPENLAEGELFGHVKGAYTGAQRDRIGLIEAANGGTLFLDEIGETPPRIQVSLLRFLQEKTIRPVGSNETRVVNTRLITATNRDLSQLIDEGTFREDYFFRFRGFQIELPPLRERGNDIVLLTRYFVEREAQKYGIQSEDITIDESVYDLFRRHPFRGNVRELEIAISIAVACAQGERRLLPSHFQHTSVCSPSAVKTIEPSSISVFEEGLTLKELEAKYILHALKAHNGKKTAAAQSLGIHINVLSRKLKKILENA